MSFTVQNADMWHGTRQRKTIARYVVRKSGKGWKERMNAAESGKQKEKGSGTSECKPGNSEGTGSANGRAGTETGQGCYGNGSLGGCGK